MTGRPQLSFIRHCLLTLSFVVGLGAGFARASREQHMRDQIARRLHA